MGTPSPATALDIVQGLAGSDLGVAVLHGVDRLASHGNISDVDLAVAVPANDSWDVPSFGQMLGALRHCEAQPLLVWPYDVASYTIYVCREGPNTGAQLDFLVDSHGVGKYGVRVGSLLSRRVERQGLPALHPDDERLYLLQKRYLKRQGQEVRQLLSFPPHDRARLLARADEVFRPSAARRVHALLTGSRDPGPRLDARMTIERARWLGRRLTKPIGMVVSLTGSQVTPGVMDDLAASFRPLVPKVAVVRPGSRNPRGALELGRARYFACIQLVQGPCRFADGMVTLSGEADAPSDVARVLAAACEERWC
jgi:hypothetical protein